MCCLPGYMLVFSHYLASSNPWLQGRFQALGNGRIPQEDNTRLSDRQMAEACVCVCFCVRFCVFGTPPGTLQAVQDATQAMEKGLVELRLTVKDVTLTSFLEDSRRQSSLGEVRERGVDAFLVLFCSIGSCSVIY